MPHYLKQALLEEINEWFHQRQADGVTPINSVCSLVRRFVRDVYSFGLEPIAHEKVIMRSMCDATCMMYKADVEQKEVSGPLKTLQRPEGWTSAVEAVWVDYMSSMYFTEEYWSHFWERIETTCWEHRFPQWRPLIQSVLPFYIKRNFDILRECGLVFMEDDGNFVVADEYDGPDGYDEE